MAINLIDGNSTRIETSGSNIKIEIDFPIGYIYMSTDNTDPSTYFGGTWQRIAKGRTLVGVDENDTDFDQPEEIGGSKDLQSHSHSTYNVAGVKAASGSAYGILDTNSTSGTTGTAGTGNSGNLQPYFTVYMWKKTS